MTLKKSLMAISVLSLACTAQAKTSQMTLLQESAPPIISTANQHSKPHSNHHSNHHKAKEVTNHQLKHGIDLDLNQTVRQNSPSAETLYRPPSKTISKTISSANTLKANTLKESTVNAVATCDVNAFAAATPASIVNEINTQGVSCVNKLFSASNAIQEAAFTSENMLAAANYATPLGTAYAGGGDVVIEGLFLYLRAGYYAAFYDDNLTFAATVTPAVKLAIDAFLNNSHFYDNNNEHGYVLGEVMTTMDSAEQQHVYLPVIKQWLSRWDASYANKWSMRSAVNNIFWMMIRGRSNSEYVAAIANDTALINGVRDFALSSWMLGTDAEFLASNAGIVLGRFKSYTGAAIQPTVDAALNTLFADYEMFGFGDAVWLTAAGAASSNGDCADYGICGFEAQVEALALPQNHVCSPTVKIRSQNMTAAQHAAACATMGAEETDFHSKLKTNNVPVPDDLNAQLQVNIFDSSDDYGRYGWTIFGINTDNGGMYLEGDPSAVGNVANFIAYEASYANADHFVWNLEHEYVHYLDGRFDRYDGFNASTTPMTWWTEGIAEYIDKKDDNQAALNTIMDGSTYSLSTIFDTTYANGDSDRIYRWGYLAVRFMFETHQSEVDLMLASIRTGDWAAYETRTVAWAAAYEAEFVQWLADFIAVNDTGPKANINGPYTAEANSIIAFSSEGSSDSNGSIVSYYWYFNDGYSSTEANPVHSYNTTGTYNVSLTVTDNDGETNTVSAAVTIAGVAAPVALENGVTVNVAGPKASETHFKMQVPDNAGMLQFAINGGTGQANLYVRYGEAASFTEYDCRPYITGNDDTCHMGLAQGGTYYVMVRASGEAYSTTLTGSYAPPVALDNGVTVDVAGESSSETHFTLEVPENAGTLKFAISGGTGQANLYVRFGEMASFTEYDCRPYIGGNEETCDIGLAQAGTYYVMVRASGEAFTTTLTGSYLENTGVNNGVPDACATDAPTTYAQLSVGAATCIGTADPVWFYMGEVKYHSSIAITTDHGTGDLSLDFRAGGWPSNSDPGTTSNNPGNSECIYLTNQSEYWGYFRVTGVSAGASIVVDFDTEGCR